MRHRPPKTWTLTEMFRRLLYGAVRLDDAALRDPTDQEVIDAITSCPAHFANELQVSMSFSYARGNFAALARTLASALSISVSSDPFSSDVMTVTTSALAIPLAGLASVSNSWMAFLNLDATNYIQVETGTGGVFFCRMLAGEPAMLRAGSGVTAPFAQANTASCSMFYALWSA